MDKLKLMLLVVAVYLYQKTSGTCTSNNIENTEAIILCSGDDGDLDSEISLITTFYDPSRVNILLDNVYSNPIIVKSALKELLTAEVTLTVTNTRLTNLDEALVLTSVSELHINYCSLTKIKFDEILILKQATKFNVSHNYISTLKSAKLGTGLRLMQTIDLSYNLISSVPDNCFSSFNYLKHLNLSHNSISYLSAAAFDGISQLESLYLSYNKLSSISNIAINLRNLKKLHIDYNYILNIKDLNLMSDLEDANLGHNLIGRIDQNAFDTLSDLAILDLSGNKIFEIQSHFKNNNALRELRLTDNNIYIISKKAFAGKRFVNLFMNGNRPLLLKTRPFEGINCDYLDFSNSQISMVHNNTFAGAMMRSINLSSNQLVWIQVSSFSVVEHLLELDLSNNNLISLDFLNPGVEHLNSLFFQKNFLQKISRKTFTMLPSLELLDLSYNKIQSVDSDAFSSLKKLEKLSLNNNRLFSIQILNFQGLSALVNFDLSNTEIGNFTQAAVPGLKTTIFNCSHAQLKYIHFETFAKVENINILDLSFNSLVAFEVNPKGMSSVESLYLNNNKITSISNVSLVGFIQLQDLHLQFNDIINVAPQAFSTLKSLKILNLSYNRELQVNGDVFIDLRVLISLTMTNNKKSFDFQHTANTSIEQVDLSLCDIEDLGSLYIFNIQGVVSLNLSRNLIGYIDKNSIKTMPKLMVLDMSFNLIKSIVPGSFINTKSLANFNLHSNQLSDFQHGVFQGLTALQTLNLSNNLIHEFNINLLHSCKVLHEISFENNFITNIDLKLILSHTSVRTLYFGGNNISCHYLADFKIYLRNGYFNLNAVRSESPNYHTDNVNGVTCRPEHITDNNDAYNSNSTEYISKFTDSLENIRQAIHNSNQDYYVKGIFNTLIVTLIALIIFLVVRYVPIQRFIVAVRMPLNGNLSPNCSFNNITQRIVYDDQEI